MEKDKNTQIQEIVDKIPSLTNGQLYWVSKVLKTFECFHFYEKINDDFFNKNSLNSFGDALRIHHSFSAEPFTKDKFEYVLVKTLSINGYQAELAPKGNQGHDAIIDNKKISLKTQADKNLKIDKIWISKFMELGKGQWGDNPDDLKELLSLYLAHLTNYDKIFTLRALKRGPIRWKYELVEIPKSLLQLANNGKLEMKLNSKQFPKPGYCYVKNKSGKMLYKLYFDGGGERKLQIKDLLKENCIIHASWEFDTLV